jgi:hypothetical protein
MAMLANTIEESFLEEFFLSAAIAVQICGIVV